MGLRSCGRSALESTVRGTPLLLPAFFSRMQTHHLACCMHLIARDTTRRNPLAPAAESTIDRILVRAQDEAGC